MSEKNQETNVDESAAAQSQTDDADAFETYPSVADEGDPGPTGGG